MLYFSELFFSYKSTQQYVQRKNSFSVKLIPISRASRKEKSKFRLRDRACDVARLIVCVGCRVVF